MIFDYLQRVINGRWQKNNAGIKNGVGNQKQRSSNTEKLSPLEPWHLRHYRSLRSGQDFMVKLFFQYNFGMPKQIIEQTINAPITEIVLTDATVKHTDALNTKGNL
jgi:hypothetical protein